FDHVIDLKDEKQPSCSPIYTICQHILYYKEYLKEILDSGKIRPSRSPAVTTILFVPKPYGGSLMLCVDYRGHNRITIMNWNHLPLMNEL
ncbi:hypothetical protein K440DRAFT_502395, partial [Wilcoxina mikolae CBS 423.85]